MHMLVAVTIYLYILIQGQTLMHTMFGLLHNFPTFNTSVEIYITHCVQSLNTHRQDQCCKFGHFECNVESAYI